MAGLRIAVLGAGAIGRRHAGLVAAEPGLALAAVVDPEPATAGFAEGLGAAWLPDIDALLAGGLPDGLIVATPNRLHVEHGLAAVAAGIPALVEKPIADDPAEGRRLVAAADAAGVPLLVGHHRRHGPALRAARAAIAEGRIGRVLAVHGQCWLGKPDAYFAPAWRRGRGAGPVLVNLIHDIDALRFLCGEIDAVQATFSRAARSLPVEDGAAVTLRFAGGAVGTLSASDAVPAPWSWELSSGENPDYPRQDAFAYLVGGSEGALAVPSLELWRQPVRDWHAPLARERLAFAPADPLVAQLRHFAAVIRGEAAPRVPGREGLRTLEVIAAIHRAAESGGAVALVPEPELEGAEP
jgi:predicted dehydrogenase